MLLQETHVSCPKQAKTFERSWRGKCYWSFGTGKSADVAVLLPPHFSGSVQRFLFDSDGRILSLLFTFGLSCKLNLINIYAPNVVSERKTFFEQIHDFFLSKGDYLIAGDFNCVDRAIDKFQSDNVLSSDKSCLAALKADFSLVDVYRKLNPHGISFTWSNKNNSQVSRLDRFFISQSLFNVVCSNQVLPCTFSDLTAHPEDSEPLLFLTVYDAPHELPDSAIEHRLLPYCTVHTRRRGHFQGYPGTCNGLRHYQISLHDRCVPCYLRFGKYQLRFYHDGQIKTCRKCGSSSHLARDCTHQVCFNCNERGHTARDCEGPMLCCICKSRDHKAIDCRYLWYRRPTRVQLMKIPLAIGRV